MSESLEDFASDLMIKILTPIAIIAAAIFAAKKLSLFDDASPKKTAESNRNAKTEKENG